MNESFKTGYFKTPDFVFDLPLSAHAKLILIYFCRRSDKYGVSFPSVKTISKDTGIKSHTSIRKYIRELIDKGYITILQKGKNGVSNRYQLSDAILNMVRANRLRPDEITPSNYDA